MSHKGSRKNPRWYIFPYYPPTKNFPLPWYVCLSPAKGHTPLKKVLNFFCCSFPIEIFCSQIFPMPPCTDPHQKNTLSAFSFPFLVKCSLQLDGNFPPRDLPSFPSALEYPTSQLYHPFLRWDGFRALHSFPFLLGFSELSHQIPPKINNRVSLPAIFSYVTSFSFLYFGWRNIPGASPPCVRNIPSLWEVGIPFSLGWTFS